MFEAYYYAWIIVLVIILLVFVIAYINLISRKNQIIKHNAIINAECEKKLKEQNFEITNTMVIEDYYTYDADNNAKQKIFIDNNQKQICFINYQIEKIYKIRFDEFINYEVYNNDTNFTFGGHGGGFHAGLFGAETTKNSKELKLIIRINQLNQSHIEIPIIYQTYLNFGVSNNDKKFKIIINSLQQLCSTLEVIKNENSKK